jgi:hypothetical protein
MSQMSEMQTATMRTALPSAWATLIVWLVAKFGLDLSDDDWQVLFVVFPVIAGVAYRLGREVEARFPTVGRVLFGSSRQPVYDG